MSDMTENELKGSLERIGIIVSSGIAPASMERIYNDITKLAEKWKCDAWRLNGLFLDLSRNLKDIDVDLDDTYWFESDYIDALMDKWSLDREMARDIFPFFTSLQ